ncbi:MAG: membrane protein insertion efficiency factor YidD [Alphaproteobacteria bacterium]|nr:membrane protein insertion efficiency factor YidD [Alphaproteobacteria bacterium]
MLLILVGLVRAYRWGVSPFIIPSCRFAPSCSEYALEALIRFGALRGGYLAVRRILRCRPWGDTGYDPVPESPPPMPQC